MRGGGILVDSWLDVIGFQLTKNIAKNFNDNV